VALVAVAVLAFYLAVYKVLRYPMPAGYDTPRYLFQTNLVEHFGLAHVPKLLPPPTRSLATRTGFPVVLLTLSSLFSTTTFAVASVVPGAAATAVALASGGFVSWAWRRGVWELAVVGVVVGTSAVTIRLIAPESYTDNLLALATFVVALVPILSAVRGGPGVVAAALLVGAGGLVHPQFFELFLAILLGMAVLWVPGSWRAWRRAGRRPLETPAGRIGLVVAGAGAVAAAGFFGALRSAPLGPKQTRYELLRKLHVDVPLYRYPLTVPLAAVGLGWAAARGRREATSPGERSAARFVLALAISWGVATVVGVLWFEAGGTIAAHRLLSFLWPLPLFVGLGLLAIGAVVGARSRPAVGAAVVVVAIAGLSLLGYRELYRTIPRTLGYETLDTAKVQDAATAAAYLDRMRIPATAPVIFVIDDRGPNPLSFDPEMAYMIRSVLPAERIPFAYMYVGDPANFLAGRPTYRAMPGQYDANERRFWPSIQRLLPRKPVALMPAAYNPAYAAFTAAHPETVIAPDLALLQGPKPSAALSAAPYPSAPRTLGAGIGIGAGALIVLGLVGLGWSVALLPKSVRPFEHLALAPGVGVAALVVAGVAVDAAGVRLTGVPAALVPIVMALAGSAVAIAVRRAPSERPAEPGP
jgi:hypothetical protein